MVSASALPPETEVVADDRGSRRDNDHGDNPVVALRRENAKGDQRSLSWNRDSERLDRHRGEQQREPVMREEGRHRRSSVSIEQSRSALDELLATVDVESRASDGGVRHQVDGESGDVLRAYDTPYRQGCPELLAPRVEAISEDRRGQGRVHEPRCNQVDADRGELEGKASGQSGHGSGDCGGKWCCGRTSSACAADQQQTSRGLQRVLGQTRDVNGKHDPLDAVADVADVELREGDVVGTAPRHEHVVDQWQVGEEADEPVGVTEIERRDARAKFETDSVQPVRVVGRQDHSRSLLSSASGRLESDSGAAAQDHYRLARELLLGAAPAHGASRVEPVAVPMRSPEAWRSSPRTPSIAPSFSSASLV
jgi:hypothetical protein